MPDEESRLREENASLRTMRQELGRLRQDVASLRTQVELQGALLDWLKRDGERQERNHNYLWAHVKEEFARAFLWIDALACKILPGVVTFANDVAAKTGRSPGEIIPPHRLGPGARSRTK